MTKAERLALVRKMADAAIKSLTDKEWDALEAWAEKNIAGDIRYALEDAIKLVIAWE